MTLGRLAEALVANMTSAQTQAARARAQSLGAAKDAKIKAQKEKDHAVRDESPLHASRFMEELGAALPDDAIIFDEALTSSPDLTRHIPPKLPGHFFQTRGGS
jgi:benzoylformate decarboxylase